MKAGQTYRRGKRYILATGDEHRNDCKCGRCLEFDAFIDEKFPGMQRTAVVRGHVLKIASR